MGEIKSTLDIVLEKTKHLTLSEEEKAAQKQIEVKKRLKGLMQKYTDRLLSKKDLEKELEGLRKTHDLDPGKIFAHMLLANIEIDRKNEACLKLLNETCGLNILELEAVGKAYQNEMKLEAEKRTKKIKNKLAKKRFISGSAVVPNLETDHKWQSTVRTVTNRYDQMLKEEKAKIIKRL